MCKSCDNCYWKSHLHENTCLWLDTELLGYCKDYTHICECGAIGIYSYKEGVYCKDCLIKALGLKEKHAGIQYFKDGEYLGTSEEFDDFIEGLDVKIIEINY